MEDRLVGSNCTKAEASNIGFKNHLIVFHHEMRAGLGLLTVDYLSRNYLDTPLLSHQILLNYF